MAGVPSFEFGIEAIALASLIVLLSGILSMLLESAWVSALRARLLD